MQSTVIKKTGFIASLTQKEPPSINSTTMLRLIEIITINTNVFLQLV